MKKHEMVALLRSAGVDENAITLAINAWEMGAEDEREECAKLCEEERINAVHYSAPTQSNWLAKKIRAR